MKLLFDQNISFRILRKIETLFPGSQQTKNLKLDGSSDIDIWEYASRNNYCIVTFDSDFIDISLLRGFPPKIIWLKMGNSSTVNIAEILIKNQTNIIEFLDSAENAYLKLE